MGSFVEAVLKRKVATICDHVGYNAITRESSNVLVDLYRRTIIHLARHCKEAANNNRRVEPTLVDLVQAYDFVGISIPELKEHAESVRIPFDVKLECHEDEVGKPSNRIQRNLFVDDLLDAEKNIGQPKADGDNENGGENKLVNDTTGANANADDEDKNMTPLLKDIYQEISTNVPGPGAAIKADKVRIKREEKPVIPKLKITPLDPSIAEPPSFLPILGGTNDGGLPFASVSHRTSPLPPLSEKPKRGRQKGAKLKTTKAQAKASSSSLKASSKVVAKAKGKGAKTKLKTKIKTKLKTKGRGGGGGGRQLKTVGRQAASKRQSRSSDDDDDEPLAEPELESATYSPPAASPPPAPTAVAQLKIKTDPYLQEDAALQEAPTLVSEPAAATAAAATGKQSKQKEKKKKKRSSNQFAIVTETVTAAAADGGADEEEWLCPNCNGPDNGDLMVGCDQCELWYHLRCTNLKKPPKDDENWLCSRCTQPPPPPSSSSSKNKTPTPTLSATAITPTLTASAGAASTSSTKSHSSKGRKRAAAESSSSSAAAAAARPEKTAKLETTPQHHHQHHTPTPPAKAATTAAFDFVDEPTTTVSQPPVISNVSQDDLCPECQLPDDGTLMIQCDDPFCARWFHGKCVSVLEEPKDDESWFCKVCVDKQQSAFKRRRRAI